MSRIRTGRSKAGLRDRALCRIVLLGQEVGPLMMMQIWWRLQIGNANDDIARPSPMQDCPFGTKGWCSNDHHILSGVVEMFVRRSHFGTKWQCPFGRTNFSKWAFPYFDLSQYFGNVWTFIYIVDKGNRKKMNWEWDLAGSSFWDKTLVHISRCFQRTHWQSQSQTQ